MNKPGWVQKHWYDLRLAHQQLEGGSPYDDVEKLAKRAVALANERDPETGELIQTLVSITSTRWPGDLGSVEVSPADTVESVIRQVQEVDEQA